MTDLDPHPGRSDAGGTMDTFVPRSFVTAIAIFAVGASACGKSGSKTTDVKKSLEDGFAIGLLLPESKTTRYETFDKPLIEKYVHASCPKCRCRLRHPHRRS